MSISRKNWNESRARFGQDEGLCGSLVKSNIATPIYAGTFFVDCELLSGNITVTSSDQSGSDFAAVTAGMRINGFRVTPGTTVASVGIDTLDMSAPATGNASSASERFDDPAPTLISSTDGTDTLTLTNAALGGDGLFRITVQLAVHTVSNATTETLVPVMSWTDVNAGAQTQVAMGSTIDAKSASASATYSKIVRTTSASSIVIALKSVQTLSGSLVKTAGSVDLTVLVERLGP